MEKTRLGFIRFFTGYFKGFHKLILTNVLFSLPSAAIVALIYFINSATGLNSSFISFLPIIFCFPFLSGVTVVTRNMARGDKEVLVCSTFFKALKENFWRFLIHGVLYYAVFFLCYSSIAFYAHLVPSNGLFWFPLGLAIIFAILAAFAAYNIPLMSVTFDLSIWNIYKNAALMSFGELKNNFFATVGLALLSLIIATIYLTVPGVVGGIILLVIVAVFVPSTAMYIINFYCFKDMARTISADGASSAGVDIEPEKKDEPEVFDFSDLDLDESKDDDEYLFFNGRMIKRKTLRKMRDESSGQ